MRRLIGYLFACSHHGVVENPSHAWVGIAHCQGRWRHRGPHTYPFGLTDLRDGAS